MGFRTPSFLLVLTVLAMPVLAQGPGDRDTLVQVSTLDALMAGLYDGLTPVRELRTLGDTGIGTVHALDGEMIALDGTFYQVTSDGAVHKMGPSVRVPFAVVTWFDRDLTTTPAAVLDLPGLTKLVDGMIPSPNLFHAIRVDGEFNFVRTRSVPKQSRPYPKLSEVAAHQPTFDLKRVRGTLIGLRCPYFVKGANLPGYHFHFVDEARTCGGHVLGLELASGVVSVDVTPRFHLSLPTTREFLHGDFQAQDPQAVEAVEKAQ